MASITVYCGSNMGNDPSFARAAKDLGHYICRKGHSLVYGGGNVGLMGLIADTVLEGGGQVTGIIPEFLLAAEKGHKGLHTLEVVKSMSQRKNRMIKLGDIFVTMPGGIGTLEEITEVISLRKLGLHDKPCVLFNFNGFYEPLKEQFLSMTNAGYLSSGDLHLISFIQSPEELDDIIVSE